MSLPLIVGITCTFGRTVHLVEMLESFLRQDYAGPSSLVIFNSCPDQTLLFEHPKVKVVNATIRPPTMGDTRNAAIEHAVDGALLVVLDDDDIVLPNHFSNVVRGFDPEKHYWSHLEHQLFMEGTTIRDVTHGTPNVFSFTKEAWLKADKYWAINCGEDRDFIGRVTQLLPGVKVPLENAEVSYIYCWNQGSSVYHLSGKGDDQPGQPRGFDRSLRALQERLDSGLEPKGTINLVPKWTRDYVTLAAAFTGGVKRLENSRRGKIGISLLGHAGDIINILPVARHIFLETGVKPLFFTSKMYGDVLDGVSYVEAIKLDLHDKDIRVAIQESEKRCEINLVPQCHGDGYQLDRVCDSYNQETWRMAGMLPHFHDTQRFPLVFDQRSPEREAKLLKEIHFENPGKCMLVNLKGGFSSPFDQGQELQNLLTEHDSQCPTYLDLSKIRAERLYDMLAILERGTVLVSSDTYTLHLATACDIPVIAITNDNPQPFGRTWLSTIPRCNCILKLGYSDAVSRIAEIHQAIERL